MTTSTALERALQQCTAAAVHACAAHEAIRAGHWLLADWELYLVSVAVGAAELDISVVQDIGEPQTFLDAQARLRSKGGPGSA